MLTLRDDEDVDKRYIFAISLPVNEIVGVRLSKFPCLFV